MIQPCIWPQHYIDTTISDCGWKPLKWNDRVARETEEEPVVFCTTHGGWNLSQIIISSRCFWRVTVDKLAGTDTVLFLSLLDLLSSQRLFLVALFIFLSIFWACSGVINGKEVSVIVVCYGVGVRALDCSIFFGIKCVGWELAAKYMCYNGDKGHFEECLSDNSMEPCEPRLNCCACTEICSLESQNKYVVWRQEIVTHMGNVSEAYCALIMETIAVKYA